MTATDLLDRVRLGYSDLLGGDEAWRLDDWLELGRLLVVDPSWEFRLFSESDHFPHWTYQPDPRHYVSVTTDRLGGHEFTLWQVEAADKTGWHCYRDPAGLASALRDKGLLAEPSVDADGESDRGTLILDLIDLLRSAGNGQMVGALHMLETETMRRMHRLLSTSPVRKVGGGLGDGLR